MGFITSGSDGLAGDGDREGLGGVSISGEPDDSTESNTTAED